MASIEQMMEHHLGRMKEHVGHAETARKAGNHQKAMRHAFQAGRHHDVINHLHGAVTSHYCAEADHASMMKEK